MAVAAFIVAGAACAPASTSDSSPAGGSGELPAPVLPLPETDPSEPEPSASSEPARARDVDCAKLVIVGDPRATTGATWTYVATHDAVAYSLQGILYAPAGSGPHPAVVLSHGHGGSPASYSGRMAKTMVGWGLVGIGVQYSHAPRDEGLPSGGDGASPENLARAYAARSLLSCLGYVDPMRVAAHGHSMGAFVTGELVGAYPKAFRVASHTAGGANEGGEATTPSTAAAIEAPYQVHHGADDTTLIGAELAFVKILTDEGIESEYHVYPGVDHAEMAFDGTMLERVRAWYSAHGMF